MLQCCVCREDLHAYSFSRKQMSKSVHLRICMDCMPERPTKQHCNKCDQNLSSDLFSYSQLSKGITRKCKQCIASEITKQKIDMFYHSIEKDLKDDEREVFQSAIHNALNE
eukprot:146575_1